MPALRFKVRTLLYAVLCAALFAAYVGAVVSRGSQQIAKVRALAEVGGVVGYDLDSVAYEPTTEAQDSWVREKLREIFGDEYYGSVKQIGIVNPTPKSLLPTSVIDLVHSFPYVTHLSVYDYEITGETINELAQLKQLRSVEFHQCLLDEKAISSLEQLDNLESIGLSDPSLDCQILEQVSSSIGIQHLRLTSYKLDSKCLQKLRLSSSLTSLTLWGLTMSDVDLKWIAESLHLKSLVLQNIEGISNKGLAELKASQTLEALAVLNCDGVSEFVGKIKQLP